MGGLFPSCTQMTGAWLNCVPLISPTSEKAHSPNPGCGVWLGAGKTPANLSSCPREVGTTLGGEQMHPTKLLHTLPTRRLEGWPPSSVVARWIGGVLGEGQGLGWSGGAGCRPRHCSSCPFKVRTASSQADSDIRHAPGAGNSRVGAAPRGSVCPPYPPPSKQGCRQSGEGFSPRDLVALRGQRESTGRP